MATTSLAKVKDYKGSSNSEAFLLKEGELMTAFRREIRNVPFEKEQRSFDLRFRCSTSALSLHIDLLNFFRKQHHLRSKKYGHDDGCK